MHLSHLSLPDVYTLKIRYQRHTEQGRQTVSIKRNILTRAEQGMTGLLSTQDDGGVTRRNLEPGLFAGFASGGTNAILTAPLAQKA